LRREGDRYRQTASNGWIDDMKDAAFNASVTAWQLVDWIYNDMTAEQRAAFKVHRKRDVANAPRRRLESRAGNVADPTVEGRSPADRSSAPRRLKCAHRVVPFHRVAHFHLLLPPSRSGLPIINSTHSR
jgi:hypothetical protein